MRVAGLRVILAPALCASGPEGHFSAPVVRELRCNLPLSLPTVERTVESYRSWMFDAVRGNRFPGTDLMPGK